METTVEIHGKQCEIRLSKTAEKALENVNSPILVEMQITMACMFKKKLLFHENQINNTAVSVSDRLQVYVTSGEHSSGVLSGKAPSGCSLPPITNWGGLIPKWLYIDYRSGKWTGDFGYSNQ